MSGSLPSASVLAATTPVASSLANMKNAPPAFGVDASADASDDDDDDDIAYASARWTSSHARPSTCPRHTSVSASPPR